MSQAGRAILERMLERLFAAIVSGPSMNCRPHNSRQRIDLFSLSRFKDIPPAAVLSALFSEGAKGSIRAAVPSPPLPSAAVEESGSRTEEEARPSPVRPP